MAADTPPERTVLASQAPDCRPTGLPAKVDFSHSGHLIVTAAAIAAACKRPTLDVLETCAKAAEALLSHESKCAASVGAAEAEDDGAAAP
jgi:hypothetical protein